MLYHFWQKYINSWESRSFSICCTLHCWLSEAWKSFNAQVSGGYWFLLQYLMLHKIIYDIMLRYHHKHVIILYHSAWKIKKNTLRVQTSTMLRLRSMKQSGQACNSLAPPFHVTNCSLYYGRTILKTSWKNVLLFYITPFYIIIYSAIMLIDTDLNTHTHTPPPTPTTPSITTTTTKDMNRKKSSIHVVIHETYSQGWPCAFVCP